MNLLLRHRASFDNHYFTRSISYIGIAYNYFLDFKWTQDFNNYIITHCLIIYTIVVHPNTLLGVLVLENMWYTFEMSTSTVWTTTNESQIIILRPIFVRIGH
jgi:hypothetical protein